MTHTVHPYGHRLGIIRGWRSRWFSRGADYKLFLKQDVLIRGFLEKRLKGLYVSSLEIERNGKMFKIILKTARPGMVIGRQGEGTAKLKSDVEHFMRKHAMQVKELRIEIEEVRSPESDAGVVALTIVEGLEKRLAFRRVIKQTMDKVMANRNVLGARFAISGRLGGAEMSRKEELKRGMLPLQTFRADVDFSKQTAILPYGTIGVKVWIYRGEVFVDKGQQKNV